MTGAEILFLIFAVVTCGGALAVVYQSKRRADGFLADHVAGFDLLPLLSLAGRLCRRDAAFGLRRRHGRAVDFRRDADGKRAVHAEPHVRVVRRAGLGGGRRNSALLNDLFDCVHRRLVEGDQDTGHGGRAERTRLQPGRRGNTARPIGMKFIGVSLEDIGRPGEKLSAGYLLPFEIVSIHLLVVLIGASIWPEPSAPRRSAAATQRRRTADGRKRRIPGRRVRSLRRDERDRVLSRDRRRSERRTGGFIKHSVRDMRIRVAVHG